MQPTLAYLETLARRAGEILREGYNKDHKVDYKGVIDLVTEVDHQSEAFLLGEVRRDFSSHHIFSEESGVIEGSNDHIWYIDPLDGTVNYAHHVPIFSVSIAYASHGTVSLGAVYDPLRGEMFLAERGKGAWLNGRPLRVSAVTELQKSLLVTGFPYDAWNTEQDNFANFVKFAKMTQGVRRLGSAALDLCYVAAGRFDGFWELALKPWDVAAGGLICEEAGGRVTNVRGEADYISPPQSVVAATPGIHARMLDVLHS
ncbi:MAG: inositol monophosphatase family protein [Chloroflexota bacterium]|nr:inositol monophosphatase [Chloroflexota bacterium]MBI5704952.1 inositol monophosphatase [Chloroflexota bacterium]